MPEVGKFLSARGHSVRAITATTGAVDQPPFPLRTLRQSSPLPLRLPWGAAVVAASARSADVIYASGLYARSAVAATVTSASLVLKLVNDPAYERARSRGFYDGSLEAFQGSTKDPRISALKALRHWTVLQASQVIVPSRYLGKIIGGWDARIPEPRVIPNPPPDLESSAPREEVRAKLQLMRPTAVFAGRFVLQKDLGLALRALAQTPGLDLVLIGDGPERPAVEREIVERGLVSRIRTTGALPRRRVLDWLRAADLTLLTSAWENHPHVLVESLAVGTPAVATAVGGVPEIIDHRQNGLLVPAGDARSLAEALRQCIAEPGLLDQLRAGAARTSPASSQAESFEQIEAVLVAAASTDDGV